MMKSALNISGRHDSGMTTPLMSSSAIPGGQGFGAKDAFIPAGEMDETERRIAEEVAGSEGQTDSWENLESTDVPVELQRALDSGEAAVLFWRALIMPVRPQKKSRGGILLVDESQQNAQYLTYIGKVVALGPLWCEGPNFAVYDTPRSWLRRLVDRITGRPGEQRPRWMPDLSPGDWVIYGRHAGQRVEYKGIKFLLVNDDEKLMKIASPEGWRIYS